MIFAAFLYFFLLRRRIADNAAKGNSPLLQGMQLVALESVYFVYSGWRAEDFAFVCAFILSFKWSSGKKESPAAACCTWLSGVRDMRYLSQLFIGKVSPLSSAEMYAERDLWPFKQLSDLNTNIVPYQ